MARRFAGRVDPRLALNAFWLLEWLEYWWILLPLHLNTPLLPEDGLLPLWESPIWGSAGDRVLLCGLLPTAVVGVVLYNQTGQRATARLFGLGMVGFLTLAVVSSLSQPLGRFGLARLLIPGLFFALLPAAHASMANSRRVSPPSQLGGCARTSCRCSRPGFLRLTL